MNDSYVSGKPRATDRAKWAKARKDRDRSVRSQAVSWAHDTKTTTFGMVERNDKVRRDGYEA
jgi:hypothetical protein